MICQPIEQLIQALRTLPGIGPKTAQRLAFHILAHEREGGEQLAHALIHAVKKVGHCDMCRNFSETPLCHYCASPRRQQHLLCIVENPLDILAVEHTGSYQGLYFVLMGHLSPLDQIGPQELGIPILESRLKSHPIEEIILATNPTVEGDATAHYLVHICKPYVTKLSRIAYGVPLGGELEWVNTDTLARALSKREEWV